MCLYPASGGTHHDIALLTCLPSLTCKERYSHIVAGYTNPPAHAIDITRSCPWTKWGQATKLREAVYAFTDSPQEAGVLLPMSCLVRLTNYQASLKLHLDKDQFIMIDGWGDNVPITED